VPQDRPRRDRPAFWVLAVLLVAIGVELGCRFIERLENDAARRRNPYVEPIHPVPAFRVADDGGRKMVWFSGLQPLMTTSGPFPLERPAGGLRIFVLGGSAAAGWPYHAGSTNLSALLARKLRQLFPDRPIEVFNMAAGTYASHRVKLILEEVLAYHPDAIFLYNGNNELLEGLVYRPRAPPAPWSRSATVRLTYRVAAALTTPKPTFDVQHYSLDDVATSYISFALGKASRYREDPGQLRALLDHYRYNVESMVASASAARVPIFLVTCPVNLRDWSPSVSRHRSDLSPTELAAWIARFRTGALAAERGAWSVAIAPLHAALAIDDDYALAHYLLAEALRRTGRGAEAKTEYVRALERDGFPFRELPEFQAILRDVAARSGAPLVDVLPPLEAASEDGIPGLDVFTDYVHLNERGQEIAAHELLRALLGRGMLPGRTPEDVERSRISVERSFDPQRDAMAAEVNVQMALLMHQDARLDALYDEAIRVLDRAARENPSLAAQARYRIGVFRLSRQIAARYAALQRAERFGLVEREFSPGEVEEIVARYREMIFEAEGANLPREELLRRFPPGAP
jgi:tetratricopeptide (TPR) repeat protein